MSDTTTLQRRSSRLRLVAFAALAPALALVIDATLVEPYRLEVTRYIVREPIAAPLTIAHVSDLHTRGFGRHERAVVEAIDAEKPDLIVVTGDSVTDVPHPEVVGEVLSKLRAPLGVWLVRGNWEHWHPVRHPETFYAGLGVHYLDNSNGRVRGDVWIAGFDDAMLGAPDLEKGLANIPPRTFVLGIFHSPAFFDHADARVPLALAGHTHGGQVRLPGLPPVWLPRGSGRFVEGWYADGDRRMYVSRGIGTSVLPIRFDCEPELAIIRLEPG